ncbi:MAG: HpcH/HpaI aldolase/citrate lyase family protein [Fusobacteriaceae bacterium]|nr:HpcH/HpaI aldolase/citrate lyase family protein [Fusobacteriaceae bacterium]
MEKEYLVYSVGALLYTPAISEKIADDIIDNKIDSPFSISLCLEDSISEDAVEFAENQVVKNLEKIFSGKREKKEFYCPKIFIRVRYPKQIFSIFDRIKEFKEIFTGFILPKYSLDNVDEYNHNMLEVNKISDKIIYMMPILESGDIADLNKRYDTLRKLKVKIDGISDIVLNIRVGGNDFCNIFGLRRHSYETIYEITPVKSILSDILTVFSREYVISAPVWEYFGNEKGNWSKGLENEIKYDKLNGFIGKTVIHPSQISIVNDSLKIDENDYNDALSIINWREGENLQVLKSANMDRMNEIRTHLKWAQKIVKLAQIYGTLKNE